MSYGSYVTKALIKLGETVQCDARVSSPAKVSFCFRFAVAVAPWTSEQTTSHGECFMHLKAVMVEKWQRQCSSMMMILAHFETM